MDGKVIVENLLDMSEAIYIYREFWSYVQKGVEDSALASLQALLLHKRAALPQYLSL